MRRAGFVRSRWAELARRGFAREKKAGHGVQRITAAVWGIVLSAALSGCVESSVEHGASRPVEMPSADRSGSSCQADLRSRDADFTPLTDRFYGAGCSTINAVRLISLHSDEGAVLVSGLGPVTCPLAERIAAWGRFGVDRAAREYLGNPIQRIETMGSYSCRDVAGTTRLSAHASANAVDVSGFVLADGERITVLGDWNAGSSAQRTFLRVIRSSACKRFSTVLSPDYNPAHRDHFHLEIGAGHACR